MHLAIWLVGLTYQLSALVIETLQYRLHPKQESFIKQLSSYEIITPLRVNDFGESFPHKLHYRRRRRSLNDDLSGLRLLYRIDAFGERFHLNLSADSSFIAPSYTVTHLGAERSSDTDSDFHDPGDMRHCFFRGHVNARSEHPAVFSLCTGLVGTFTTQHAEYFLEPLSNAFEEEYDEEHNKPHLVYRHERRRNNLHPDEPCAASGNRLANSFAPNHIWSCKDWRNVFHFRVRFFVPLLPLECLWLRALGGRKSSETVKFTSKEDPP
ncbi:hypothetical protein XENORESO_008452 [Xenotaenia resolanae]|uniref:Peptidase M12B propeptide domain-containing protein n=1 Tax=Xenotaenia resolanae TaxID=208358 RepID=A0ABV0X4J7_9TELE